MPEETETKPDELGLLRAMEKSFAQYVVAETRFAPYAENAKRATIWATGFRDCTRAMALDLIYPNEREELSADSCERMAEGNEMELALVARLMHVGQRSEPPFAVVDQQKRFEIVGRAGRPIISGKIDCRLVFRSGGSLVLDVKRWLSGRRATTADELLENVWTRRAVFQMLAYLYDEWKTGNPNPLGAFLVAHGRGLPDAVPVRLLDYLDLAERFLSAADEAVEARYGERELPPYSSNPADCKRCDHFGRSCKPPALDFGDGILVVTDERLHELKDAYLATRDAAEANARARDELWEALRGVPSAVIGDALWSGSWRKRTVYDVPEDVAERQKSERELYRRVEPRGSFVGKIERGE